MTMYKKQQFVLQSWQEFSQEPLRNAVGDQNFKPLRDAVGQKINDALSVRTKSC
jgi:hypothetical protein